MRLTEEQAKVIREVAREVFGAEAIVRLFGSRIDDAARGGDIDLLVENPDIVENKALKASLMEAKIQLALGERKVDVLVVDPSTLLQPVHRAALSKGIVL